MQLLLEGITRAETVDAAAFIDAIHTIRDLDLGTTSPLTFTPDRHLGGSMTVLIHLEEGRFVRLSDPQTYGEADPG